MPKIIYDMPALDDGILIRSGKDKYVYAIYFNEKLEKFPRLRYVLEWLETEAMKLGYKYQSFGRNRDRQEDWQSLEINRSIYNALQNFFRAKREGSFEIVRQANMWDRPE